MAASTGTMALAASCLSSSSKANHSFKVSLAAVRICSALALRRTISLKPASSLLPYLLFSQKSRLFRQGSAMQDILLEDKHVVAGEKSQFEEVNRTKLYVVNLPLDCTASYLENLFGRFGTVNGVEIIKKKNGENRGFAFVVMSSEEEAQVAIEKLNSYELSGRIIRVELAKRFNKPISTPLTRNSSKLEMKNDIYVSNLAWKVRSGILRDFFATKFKPVSARVIFDTPSGRSAGYGFVSFATKEEAEAAVSELNGEELMGRPLRLRLNEKKNDQPESEESADELQS